MDHAVLKTGDLRQLMNELLAIEPHRRQEAVREQRYRSLMLAEMLAKEGGQFEETCPAKAEELAELARMVADQPHPGSAVARVDRVLAVSHCLQGNARRLSGDRSGAEQQFRRAAAVLTGPPAAVERALYCQKLALLREEQGRFEEATTLLWRAVGIFREARSVEGQVSASAGWVSSCCMGTTRRGRAATSPRRGGCSPSSRLRPWPPAAAWGWRSVWPPPARPSRRGS